MALGDRVMVLANGEVTGIVDAKTTSKEEIGLMMLGQHQKKEGKHLA